MKINERNKYNKPLFISWELSVIIQRLFRISYTLRKRECDRQRTGLIYSRFQVRTSAESKFSYTRSFFRKAMANHRIMWFAIATHGRVVYLPRKPSYQKLPFGIDVWIIDPTYTLCTISIRAKVYKREALTCWDSVWHLKKILKLGSSAQKNSI